MEKSSLFLLLRMKRGKLVLLVFVKLFLMGMSGKLVICLELLYRHVEMVVHGNARGRTIGYPTANLVLRDRTYMPADGVYVVDIEVQR